MPIERLKLFLWISIGTFVLSWGSVAVVFLMGSTRDNHPRKHASRLDESGEDEAEKSSNATNEVVKGRTVTVNTSKVSKTLIQKQLEDPIGRRTFSTSRSSNGRYVYVSRNLKPPLFVDVATGRIEEQPEFQNLKVEGPTPDGRYVFYRKDGFLHIYDRTTKQTNYRLVSDLRIAVKNRVSELSFATPTTLRFELDNNGVTVLDLKRGKILMARGVKKSIRYTDIKKEKRLRLDLLSPDLRYQYHATFTREGLVIWAFDETDNSKHEVFKTSIQWSDNARVIGNSGNRRYLAISTSDSVFLFDLVGRQILGSFKLISNQWGGADISNDGKFLAYVDYGVLKMLDISSGKIRTIGVAAEDTNKYVPTYLYNGLLTLTENASHIAYVDKVNYRITVWETGVHSSSSLPPSPKPFYEALESSDRIDPELRNDVREIVKSGEDSVFVE